MGEKALMNAAAKGNMTGVAILLDTGVNVNANDDAALKLALLHDYDNIAELLIKRGAHVSVGEIWNKPKK